MTGIHRLEHVQGLTASYFTDDNSVGSHSKRIADQHSDGDFPFAFQVRRPAFQPDHVLLLKPQFGGVLDGHYAFIVRNVGRQHVQRGSLAASCSTRDYDVQARGHARTQEISHILSERPEVNQIGCGVRLTGELSHGKRRPRHRQRRDNSVHARAVRQPRVHHWGTFIDATP